MSRKWCLIIGMVFIVLGIHDKANAIGCKELNSPKKIKKKTKKIMKNFFF